MSRDGLKMRWVNKVFIDLIFGGAMFINAKRMQK
jgi:hypothetical protein